MARTILEIAQEAAQRDSTAPKPAKLFDTNDRIARDLRIAAKDTMRDFMRSSNWLGLSELHSTWVFNTTASRYAYEMPPDFLRVIPDTEQRNGWPLGLVGPVTPQAWAHWIFGGQSVVAPMGWRIRNNVLFIEPTPTAAELMAIEYISRYPVVSAIQDGDYDLTTYPLKTNVPVVARDGWMNVSDETTIVGYGATDGRWDGAPGYDDSTWPNNPEELLRRIHPLSAEQPEPEVRRAEFTADTDKPAFDDDYLLSLGMTFRLRRSLGKPYAEHAAEYEDEMESKLNGDGGGTRDFRFGGDDVRPDILSLGGNKWLIG